MILMGCISHSVDYAKDLQQYLKAQGFETSLFLSMEEGLRNLKSTEEKLILICMTGRSAVRLASQMAKGHTIQHIQEKQNQKATILCTGKTINLEESKSAILNFLNSKG